MSAERDVSVDVEVDLEDDRLDVAVVERREQSVEDLFRDGRLMLWKDPVGWKGFELRDGDYYRIHKRTMGPGSPVYIEEERVTREAVIEAIREHVRDPEAGGAGEFERRCSPP